MKRKIFNWILLFLAVAVVFLVYGKLFKISAAAIFIIVGIIVLYHFCGKFSWKSIREIRELEAKLANTRLDKSDYKKALFYSLAILSPMYFCVVLISLVPFHSFESWFIVGFPSLVLLLLQGKAVLDSYKDLTGKKWSFVLAYFSIIAVIYLVGQILISLVL